MFLKKKNKKIFQRSFRNKLIISYFFVLFFCVFSTLIYFYFQINKEFQKQTKEFLKSEFKITLKLLKENVSTIENICDFLSKNTTIQRGLYKINYALYDKNCLLIACSDNFIENQEIIKEFYHKNNCYEDYNIYEKQVKNKNNETFFLMISKFKDILNNDFFLQFKVKLIKNISFNRILLKTIFFAIPGIIIFVIILSVFLTNSFLYPILNLIKSAKKVSLKNNEKNRLPVSGINDELDQLASIFNNIFDELQQSYDKIIMFTADASHELRLPITAIKGEAEVVLERERDLEEYRNSLRNIIEEMDRLIQMINSLLSLARRDMGKDTIKKEQIDLYILLKRLVEFYRVLADKKDINIYLDLEKNSFIKADLLKMQELFSNLLENAIKYTKENGKVEIKLKKSLDKCVISIIDTGIGIEKGEQEKIFDRFYRVDKSRSRKEGGIGLGLSIVKMIVEMHNGNIKINSKINKGTCFNITLPVS